MIIVVGCCTRGQPMTLAKTPEILPTGSPDCFYQQYRRTKKTKENNDIIKDLRGSCTPTSQKQLEKTIMLSVCCLKHTPNGHIVNVVNPVHQQNFAIISSLAENAGVSLLEISLGAILKHCFWTSGVALQQITSLLWWSYLHQNVLK